MELRRVGFFRELSYGTENDPTIKEKLPYRLQDEDNLLEYLNSGLVFVLSPGIERDVFLPDKIIGSITIRTDGIWAWPESLMYYLKNYHIILPEDFVESIRILDYRVPDTTKIDLENLQLSD
jgi:hypothetical protein